MVSWCSITVLWESQTLSVVLVLFKVHQTAPVEKITKSADPQQQSPVGVPLSNASLECGQWAWFLWEIQHCTSGMGTVLHHGDPMLCWAFADQTQPSNLIHMPDPTTWPGPANILSYIPYEGGLLITLNQTLFLVYLGNGCLDLPHIHIPTAFTQDLTSEAGLKHILKLSALSDQAGLTTIITQWYKYRTAWSSLPSTASQETQFGHQNPEAHW